MTTYTPPDPQGWPPPAPQPDPQRSPTRKRWAGIAKAAVVGAIAFYFGFGAGMDSEPASSSDPVEVVTETVTETVTDEAREAELDERETAISQAEEAEAANTVGDGIHTVGVDIEPGTYRAVDVSSDCYWAVLVSGTNGDDIVNNGIPGGGSPQVSIEVGHDFETRRCGEWTR
ncbi:MAG: hypothetical protein GEU78_19335 [Actinobacteria bacterium]|nr:hypothetical protein [Actinomycetota bacterium]